MVFLFFDCAFLAACSRMAFSLASAASYELALIFISIEFASDFTPVLLIKDMFGCLRLHDKYNNKLGSAYQVPDTGEF